MQNFQGKTILITGASSGIGEAMARQLAAPDVTLLLTARSEDRLQRLADEALRSQGARAEVFPQDLARPGAAAELHGQITGAGHAVDILINNAGFGKFGPFGSYDVETYEAMLTLNVTNLVSLTRLFLPPLLERGEGAVLNVASTAAFQPVPYMSVYAATKSFVLNFSEALHTECRGRGVTVTCLCPGNTDTAFADRADSHQYADQTSAETAEKVARVGLEALRSGDMTKVSGRANALGAVAAQLAPRRLVTSLVGRFFRPRDGVS